MGYCFMHIGKIKTIGSLQSHYKHNYREIEIANAIPEKADENQELVPLPTIYGKKQTYADAYKKRIAELPYYKNHKVHKDAVLALEIVTTFTKQPDVDLEKWKEENVKWLKETFNVAQDRKDNVISVMYHGDEYGNVHCHTIVIPIDEEGHLNARRFINGSKRLSALQTSYAESMEQFGLERGVEGSSARHEDIRRYYTDLNRAIYNIPDPYEHETAYEFKKRTIEEIGTARAANLREMNLAKHQAQREIDAERTLMRKAVRIELDGQREQTSKELQESIRKLSDLENKYSIVQNNLFSAQEELEKHKKRRKELENFTALETAKEFYNNFNSGFRLLQERSPEQANDMIHIIDLMNQYLEEEQNKETILDISSIDLNEVDIVN